jgi:hypothetical protein
MTLSRFAWLAGVLLGLPWVNPATAMEGRTIDEATGSPLAGVFVIISRWASVPLGIERRTSCISYDVAISDADGRFSVSLPLNLLARMVGRIEGEDISFYKQGYYFRAPGGGGQPFVLRRDPRPTAERYAEMLAIAVKTDCASGGKGNEKAVAPLRAMHEELRSSATTSAQRRSARDWLLYIDIAEYGHDEGWKKKNARDGDWFSRCLRITRSDPMTGKTTQIIVRTDVDRSDCD